MIDKNLPVREVKSQPAPNIIVVQKDAPKKITEEKIIKKPVRPPASMSEALRAGNASRLGRDAGGEEAAKTAEDREMFKATCSTCEQEILVPFKPDPKRPTFCKECLKDYQRMVARSRQDNPPIVVRPDKNNFKEIENEAASQETEPVVFVANEKPMSLSQISSMASKKFKPIRKKPMVDLKEVRRLINDK